ncbi:MAG: hypothetical protein R3F65_32225 [bacterium]
MHKIKLIIAGGLDGQTLVEQAPSFRLREGWSEAEIAAPAGVFPAGLWGQVPAGDPYLLHASMLTTQPIDAQTIFEVMSGDPPHSRGRFTPGAENTRLSLVRPSDRLRVFAPPQALVKIELLIESIGGEGELGSRLWQWASASQAGGPEARTAYFGGSAKLSPWTGTIHVIYDSAQAGSITLPPRASVPMSAVLTITRRAGGVAGLLPSAGDSVAGGLNSIQVFRSAIVMNNGDEWTWAGS